MIFSPFWVQAYRLPFLSKSRSLAKSLASILGEFLAVHDDSLNEGWGPFLRFRVKMDITKLLLRGRMISLPKIRDEFWVEFRYERLPNYCMECGLIGHLYKKCSVFLEKLDKGIEPELPYGPELKGSRLPTSSYDRYRTDFSKGNGWPLLTRLTRNTLTNTIPRLRNTPQPQPKVFLMGESSNSTPDVSVTCPSHIDPRTLVVSTCTSATTSAIHPPTTSLFTPPSLNNSSLIKPPLPFNLPTTAPGIVGPVNNKGKLIIVTNINNNSPLLLDVYTPDLEIKVTTTNVFATYPPMINPTHSKSQPLQPHSAGAIQFSTVSTTAPATLHITRATLKGQENIHPNRTFKRQYDTNSMRQTLKRCRANQTAQPSLSEGIHPHQSVSTGLDSIDVQDNSAVIAQQSRDSP
uniref:Zinc knuckle CX2CX4HX4C domain-containing protein n=1 Tax=Cannabis sativa TaxID=3483 RepID=A0A803P6D7_CANSA